MTELEKKLESLNELADKISSSEILDKEDIQEMDRKVSSVLQQVVTAKKQYFKRLS